MTSSRIPFLLAASLLIGQGALAAGAKAPAMGSYATRVQLRECLAIDDGLKARLRALEAATQAHNRRFDANEAEGAQLVDMKARLDRGDKAAILAFNQAVQDHNQHLQQADDEAAAAEVANKAYGADQAAADQKCGPLTYRPADMDVVTKERAKAAAAAGSAAGL
jgi:hypothetical protein